MLLKSTLIFNGTNSCDPSLPGTIFSIPWSNDESPRAIFVLSPAHIFLESSYSGVSNYKHDGHIVKHYSYYTLRRIFKYGKNCLTQAWNCVTDIKRLMSWKKFGWEPLHKILKEVKNMESFVSFFKATGWKITLSRCIGTKFIP